MVKLSAAIVHRIHTEACLKGGPDGLDQFVEQAVEAQLDAVAGLRMSLDRAAEEADNDGWIDSDRFSWPPSR
jgi:hypothetical protein